MKLSTSFLEFALTTAVLAGWAIACTAAFQATREPAAAPAERPAAVSQGNAGPLPSFLDPLGGPDAKRQVWGRSQATAEDRPAATPTLEAALEPRAGKPI